MSGVTITGHAYDRAKERINLNRKAIDKIADKAYNEGIKHGDCKGRLRKFIDKLYLEYRSANNIRIFGEFIFLFSGNTLITLYRLPNDLKKLAEKSKACAEK